jgi:hypothetical protein
MLFQMISLPESKKEKDTLPKTECLMPLYPLDRLVWILGSEISTID